jgi:tRNA-specific 2-thiouridylase
MTTAEKTQKIVVAMSGGVDSSVAAGIMKERGFEAVGVSLQLWNYSNSDNRFGTCCSLDDLADARRVAERVGIPYYILNMEKNLRKRSLTISSPSICRRGRRFPARCAIRN